MWEQQARVEELDSDDTDTQGVGLNSGKKRFASDSLQFTGVDLASGSRARRGYAYDTEESSEDSEESEFDGTNALQVALRDKEEALVQSALARIRRAQEKGKREVKLNQDELDALEKRRKRMQSAATSKARKGSSSDRGSESEQRRRRSDQQLVTVPLSAVEPTSRRRGKSRRLEESQPHPPAASNPPGMLVAGPDGLTYAPVDYYPPQVSGSHSSPTRPRSATSQQLRGTPPPQFTYQAPGNPRHFSDNTRPTSSSSTSSRRPLPDEEGWMPGYSRRSSTSSQSYPVDPFEYQISSEQPPPIPQQYMQPQTGRRNFSGPAEVAYSSLRRNPPMSSSAYPGPSRASDPMTRRRSSRRGEEARGESSSEEDESDDLGNGVQVFVEEPERETAVVPRKAVGGGSSGRKKGKR
jgi:PRA1 family protein 1